MANYNSEPLRLLVVDKTAVIESIRERYTRLANCAQINITLLVPSMWVENYVPVHYRKADKEPFATVVGRVVWPGKEQRSFYVSGLIQAFRRSRPDIILMMEESFSLFALQVITLQRIFAPSAHVIFYSNNITSYENYLYRPSWFFRWLGKAMARRADVGLCVNKKAESVLRATGIPIDIRTLFYGINERLFTPIPEEEARRKLGLPGEGFIFLYAGRLRTLKGVQDLVAAFAPLHAAYPERHLQLLIVGTGEHEHALQEQVKELGIVDTVEFRGMVPVEEMPVYMSAANAFVLPSRAEIHEQFGRVNAEAMLIGTTIIGSTSGEIPAVIGKGGYIFKAGDVDDLQKIMEQVLLDTDDVARRNALGKKKALKDYSMAAFVEGLVSLFEELSQRPIRKDAQHD